MRRLGDTTDWMGMSLSKLWEKVKDRGACCAAAHRAAKWLSELATKQQRKLPDKDASCKTAHASPSYGLRGRGGGMVSGCPSQHHIPGPIFTFIFLFSI